MPNHFDTPDGRTGFDAEAERKARETRQALWDRYFHPTMGTLDGDRMLDRIAELEAHTCTPDTVTCDKCAFRYGAEHTKADGTYSCPLCELENADKRASLEQRVGKEYQALPLCECYGYYTEHRADCEARIAYEAAVRALADARRGER